MMKLEKLKINQPFLIKQGGKIYSVYDIAIRVKNLMACLFQ